MSGERLLVITWADELFSSAQFRRDLERYRRTLTEPTMKPLEYESAAGPTFSYVAVDELRKTDLNAVPPEWHGEVPPSLYALFAGMKPGLVRTNQIDPGALRMNVLVGDADERQTATKLADRSVVDLVAERGEQVIPDGHLALSMVFPDFWPDLFPWSNGILEAFWESALLRQALADADAGRHQEALSRAENRLADRLAPLTLPSELPFWDLLASHKPEIPALKAEMEHSISAPTWKGLRRSKRFQRIVRRPTQVTTVLGWTGYMWWELVRDLKSGFMPKLCRNCNRILVPSGRSDRIYCDASENPECFRSRGRKRAKRSRAGRLSQDT
jgi:hypothetical protein